MVMWCDYMRRQQPFPFFSFSGMLIFSASSFLALGTWPCCTWTINQLTKAYDQSITRPDFLEENQLGFELRNTNLFTFSFYISFVFFHFRSIVPNHWILVPRGNAYRSPVWRIRNVLIRFRIPHFIFITYRYYIGSGAGFKAFLSLNEFYGSYRIHTGTGTYLNFLPF